MSSFGASSHVSSLPPSSSLSPVEILLIEDDPADIRFFHEALKDCEIPCQVSVLQNGDEVRAFVSQAAVAARTLHPRLIISDLIVPGMKIEEIMAALRSLPVCKNIPVILFSTFNESEGQRCSVDYGATAFVSKPLGLEATFAAIHAIVRRWGRPEEGNQA